MTNKTDQEDNEEQDAFSRTFFGVPLQHELQALSDIKLAELHAKFSGDKPVLVIIQNEWRRREKVMQHELNLALMKEQAKIMKVNNRFIAMATISAAILGAVAQATLQYMIQPKQAIAIQQNTQSGTVPNSSATLPEHAADKVPTSLPPSK